MSRCGKHSFGRLLDSATAAPADDVEPAAGRAMLKGVALGCTVLAASIAVGMAIPVLSALECMLLSVITVLAVAVGLLLKRHQWLHRSLAAERRQLRTAVDNIPQGLVLYDASARIVVCNQPYLEMFGLSPDVAKQGCTMQRLIAHRQETGSFDGDVEAFCAAIIRSVKLGNATRQITEAPGGRAIEIVNKPLESGGWVATIEDITSRKRAEEKIAHLAHYDALTELPNRALFREKLDQALKDLKPGAQLAVLYIDIDEFKSINDALGHPIGDELLKGVAERLRGCLGEADIAARLGGDEFAIIQYSVRSAADTEALVRAIYDAIRQSLECAGHLISTDASIGIAIAPGDGRHLDELLKNADLALYGAKGDGRRTWRFFEPGMDARARSRRMLESELRQAIAAGGFEVHYQPVVDLRDNAIRGCEALLRWHHPQRGMIAPADFIPVAEDTGLINELGQFVLAAACGEATKWPEDVRIAVNVSPVQFRNRTFALTVAAALAASKIAPSRLELEITEAVLMRDDEVALATLHQLRALGVRIALDDFGTGYSSLSYLHRFPFDKIKIDRSFVKGIGDEGASAAIIQAVVNIAKASNMTTTAEGVEQEWQRDLLRDLGCTEMQGYLFSRPVSAAELVRLMPGGSDKAAIVA
ncbi:putative bifunctional diguanylate cyclase/phosphodiesterase [Bradyrhizobium sp.]|uniref:putative bifunctional diguanylate cyclase/phosphodiesterase n=1 Tax=Bradyrhizobium sp. TaxID=376 RepID=UPI002A279021|nr:EAL domain-containing protein [Bradyrhizobium sp.]